MNQELIDNLNESYTDGVEAAFEEAGFTPGPSFRQFWREWSKYDLAPVTGNAFAEGAAEGRWTLGESIVHFNSPTMLKTLVEVMFSDLTPKDFGKGWTSRTGPLGNPVLGPFGWTRA